MAANFAISLGLIASGCSFFQYAPKQATIAGMSRFLTPGKTVYGKHYKFDIVASTDSNIREFKGYVSLNARGQTLFVGKMQTGTENLLVGSANPTEGLMNLTPDAPLGQRYGNGAQINDVGLALAQDSTGNEYFLRQYDTSEKKPAAGTILVQSTPGNFDSIGSFVAVNKLGQYIFPAIWIDPNTLAYRFELASPATTSPTDNRLTVSTPARASLADNGKVVLNEDRLGPIVLYDHDLGKASRIVIADNTCFDSLGRYPGISELGDIVVFYGKLLSTCLGRLGISNPGPGIFASFEIGSGERKIIRLAGYDTVEDMDSTIAPNDKDELCDFINVCKKGELGSKSGGEPLFFANFSKDARLTVAKKERKFTDGSGGSFVVGFIATPNAAHPMNLFSANEGLWTVRTNFVGPTRSTSKVLTEQPVPVIQVGDTLKDVTVAALAESGDPVYAQVAPAAFRGESSHLKQNQGDYRVAFFFKGTSGQSFIVRGEPIESGIP